MANIPEISVQPETIFSIGDLAVSNAMLASWVVTLILLVFVLAVKAKISLVPGRLQVIAEGILEFFYEKLVDTYGKARAKKHTALIVGLFIFIFIGNQFSLIPLVQSIVVGEEAVPLFRSPTSHFALTLAMAIVVIGTAHYIALTTAPLKHIANFFQFGKLLKVRSFAQLGQALLDVFLGLLDIVGEIAKVISLSARLFGNVFAGEVMIGVISGLSAYTQFLVPVPFYALSIFSGIIQAMVFAILSFAFISGMAKGIEEPA